MKLRNRILPAALAVIIGLAPVANAAAPAVTTDESVYVNLSYYGAPTDLSIVKGCSLNGNTTFEDFGAYEKVTNMTDYAEPTVTATSVKWSLPEGTKGRFYYEVKPKKDTLVLPWNVDISYKLNGVPKKAEELAGASGLIEINVAVTANEKAPEYYRNNMLLQAATMVDMQDTLSVEAPGAQLQSVGTYKAVVFAALPGESTTFTMRIGTESFETPGIVLMMIPGTLEQLKDIKDLKEAKDTVKDSADAIHDSLNDILGTLQNMTNSFKQTEVGLKGLDSARSTISQSKGDIYAKADESLDNLTDLTVSIATLVPHLKNSQTLVNELNTDINNMVTTTKGVKDHMTEIKSSTEKIQKDIEAFRQMLTDMNAHKADKERMVDDLSEDIDNLRKYTDWLEDDMRAMSSSISTMNSALGKLDSTLGQMISQLSSGSSGSGASDDVLKAIQELGSNFNATQIATLKTVRSQIAPLRSVLSSTQGAIDTMENMLDKGEHLSQSLQEAIDLFDTYTDLLEKNHDNADSLLKEMNNLGDTAKKAADLASNLVDNAVSLNDTLNKHKDGTVAALKNMEDVTAKLNKTMDSTTGFLKKLETTMKTSGAQLDSGTQKTLNGLIGILQKSLEGIGKTPTIINANDTIKKTFDDKINEYEDENKFLNLDAELKPISFTSSKNPAPTSIQIVLRTEEISLDTAEDHTVDLEKAEADQGFWARVAAVFQKIWTGISSIFS